MSWQNTLPLKSVVLFIACGTMVFIIIFIFAKRQITRFALKSSRAPHVAIGSDIPKRMKIEVERRLNRIRDIKYEPKLLTPDQEKTIIEQGKTDEYQYYYRMKAVDAVALLDAELRNYSVCIKRIPHQSLRMFLLDQRYNGPLDGIETQIIESFIQAYNHARHEPQEFMESHYQDFMTLLNQLISHIRTRKVSGKKGVSHRVDSRGLMATTPDEIHPQLDPTPILKPVAKSSKHHAPSSAQIATAPGYGEAYHKASHELVYRPAGTATAGAGNAEVVSLLSRHSSRSSLCSRGSTKVREAHV